MIVFCLVPIVLAWLVYVLIGVASSKQYQERNK